MGKYSGDGRTGDALYLAGISGDTITRDRVGGENGPEERIIRRPCLNVCIMVQPDKYLEAATHPALQASGALARIWPAWLPVMVGKQHEDEDEPGLSSKLLSAYNALLRRLLEHESAEDDEGRPRPYLARLSSEATEARRVFHNAIQDTMADGGELEDCRKVAAKAVSQTCKLALCLHLAESPKALSDPASEINGLTWARAQTLGTWFLTEAVRVQRLAGEDPTLEATRRVLRWLERERRETLNGRTLQQRGPRPRPKAREAAAILDLLVDHGYLREETPPGTRRPVYRVHPAVCSHRSQCSRGGQ